MARPRQMDNYGTEIFNEEPADPIYAPQVGLRTNPDTDPADDFGRGGETPRDRLMVTPEPSIPDVQPRQPQQQQDGVGNGYGDQGGAQPVNVAPRRPSEPTPMAGATFEAPQPQQTPAAMPPAMAAAAAAPAAMPPSMPTTEEPEAAMAPPPPQVSLRPFAPMTSPSLGSMATPAQSGLYGSLGGLQGGGLGVPMDPTSNFKSDPISTLMKLLTQGR